MNIDSKLLASYRNLLSDTKDTLAYQQFTDLITLMEINPTKRLEKSYKSLFKAIDKYSQGDMDKLLSHRFLFEVLGASPKKRERDLKRIANHFCDFVISAGSANTEGHRLTVRKYAQLVQDSVQSLHDLDIDRKNDDFHKIWIGELRERLDTRDNK